MRTRGKDVEHTKVRRELVAGIKFARAGDISPMHLNGIISLASAVRFKYSILKDIPLSEMVDGAGRRSMKWFRNSIPDEVKQRGTQGLAP